MTNILTKLALTQVVALLNETLKSENTDIELPEDLPDKMFKTMIESQEGSLVSVRDVLPCRIPLPFMPDRIDYKIGKGCCDEIVKRDGLFVPCSHHCDEGNKCSKHLKESSGCGDYQDRFAAWKKKEIYCVVIGEKEIKEKPYGTYMHAKALDSIAIEEELGKWGIPLRLDFTQWRAPPKPLKKNRGRKSVLKVAPTETDETDQYDTDEELKGVKEAEHKEKEVHGPDTDTEPEPDTEPETEPETDPVAEPETEPVAEPETEPTDPAVEPVKKRPAPKKTKKTKDPDLGLDSEEETDAPKEKKRPVPKKEGKKKEKVQGTPLDAELKKEDMEETPKNAKKLAQEPKKGKYRGKMESLTVGDWNGVEYLTKDGKYYDSGTLEIVAWTKNGEIILL